MATQRDNYVITSHMRMPSIGIPPPTTPVVSGKPGDLLSSPSSITYDMYLWMTPTWFQLAIHAATNERH